MRTFVLAGGVGSARFCAGLSHVVAPEDLTIVVNTADDEQMRGLHVSPDVDTVLYHLAAATDWDRGWGAADESYRVQQRFSELVSRAGELDVDMQHWFTLGDLDLATNLFRTRLLAAGLPLSGAVAALSHALGIACTVLPATDDRLRTRVTTADGRDLSFQEYFVKLAQRVEVADVRFEGAARPAPGVLEAMSCADVVAIGPSNPMLSVDPILAVAGMRDALADSSAQRVAVSPIVGGRALKGPAADLLAARGHEVSPVGIARLYVGLVDHFVLDEVDAELAEAVAELGMRPIVTDTVMTDEDAAAALARTVIDALP